MLRLDTSTVPACADFRVDGASAVPISLVVEFLRSLGDWVQPDGTPPPLVAICDLAIDLAALRLDEHGVRWHAVAEGGWTPEHAWQVRIRVTDARERSVARAIVCYGKHTTPPVAPIPESDGSGIRPTWSGHMFRLGRWEIDRATGQWAAAVEADRMADLLTAIPTPRAELPLNQLETLVRGVYQRQTRERCGWFTAAALDIVATDPDSSGPVYAQADRWTACTPEGKPRVIVHSPHFA